MQILFEENNRLYLKDIKTNLQFLDDIIDYFSSSTKKVILIFREECSEPFFIPGDSPIHLSMARVNLGLFQ